MKPRESHKGRKLRKGETPTIYVAMRQWSRAEKKMLHLKGYNLALRNYTPKRVLKVMVEAFKRDIELAQQELDRQAGEVIHNR